MRWRNVSRREDRAGDSGTCVCQFESHAIREASEPSRGLSHSCPCLTERLCSACSCCDNLLNTCWIFQSFQQSLVRKRYYLYIPFESLSNHTMLHASITFFNCHAFFLLIVLRIVIYIISIGMPWTTFQQQSLWIKSCMRAGEKYTVSFWKCDRNTC